MTTATPVRRKRTAEPETDAVPAPRKRKVAAKPSVQSEEIQVPEPEINLSAYRDKPPSELNRAEAEWLIECTGLEVSEDQMDLAAMIVKLVAGPCHRHWQASKRNKELHGK